MSPAEATFTTPCTSTAASSDDAILNVPSRWNSRSTWRVVTAQNSTRSDSLRNVGTLTVRMSAGTEDVHL